MKSLKKIAILISPLLLFVVLFFPYLQLNSNFIVNWLGCGCPKLDEFGNMITNSFNANDFTAIFWTVIALVATALSVIFSKQIPKEDRSLRVLYIAGTFILSLILAYLFSRIMAWC